METAEPVPGEVKIDGEDPTLVRLPLFIAHPRCTKGEVTRFNLPLLERLAHAIQALPQAAADMLERPAFRN